MKKRKYRKTLRAEQEEQTRDKIVDAAMALHEKIGPRATSISAIAERAGVQRLTVYRHFKDDIAIFQACSSRWFELNPPPDPSWWRELFPAVKRTEEALRNIYTYYAANARMLNRVYSDAADVPALQGVMEGFKSYLDQIGNDLVKAWQPETKQRKDVRVLISHALQFSTWESFSQEKMKENRIAEVMAKCIESIAS
jgi:AcrR family transcriptional regulator